MPDGPSYLVDSDAYWLLVLNEIMTFPTYNLTGT